MHLYSRPNLGTNNNDIDSLALEIINKKSKNVSIGAQYRQKDGGFKRYKKYIENFLNKTKNSNTEIYIVSYTNLNLIDYETDIKGKNYLNLLFQKIYIPAINK